jgi:phosphoglycolate phosphatase-like HAD superfamily hydrolase
MKQLVVFDLDGTLADSKVANKSGERMFLE